MKQQYKGACHCGKIRFEIVTEDIYADIYRCNCSLCRKKGIIMKPLAADDFTLLAGAENMGIYQWNKNIAAHYFCKICGVYTHHRRRRDPTQISINLECLDDAQTPDESKIALANGKTHD